jgi:hypothetical protein
MSIWLDQIFGGRSSPPPTPPARKLQLSDVTLLIYNPEKDPNLSARVINHVCAGIEFGAIVHLAGKRPTVTHPGQWTEVAPATLWQGQRFQALELGRYFSTPFLMHIEVDGFPVNFRLWDPVFLEYDFIGAPWPAKMLGPGRTNRVGNGGCSLQSRKFRDFVDAHAHLYKEGTLSDVFLCRDLEEPARKAGIRFAPVNVALRFSFENKLPDFPGWKPEMSFGFHGRFPYFRDYLRPFGIRADK